ncbi:hypothetical protein GCM10023190_17620 [Enteractinococcus fodinae]|uniref:Cytoskeletal protein RodZ n=1 Tax=Enteractinococcus fodinae TaxID=684663 RepID=A0ABU2AXK1_9MICC|nr:hypothetical protein [Enteractinococcus fodinae]MDR7345766.1 cytoskeletal protein RodZ [Enteractinococcus fodinae]
MASIDEGNVLGGRYEITGRIMASAQQDLVLTGLDQVLNREVLILVASRENASQAAQSARQLATGERSSSIQILDLGLSDDRTYLVAPGNSDVEDFLALLTGEDVYVEPFFTEHLGTELFGESRQRTPHTYEDDTEYYAELREDLAEEPDPSKRPEFLNKLSDRIDNWLQDDEDETRVVPGQGPSAAAGAAAASTGSTRKPKTPESQRDEQPAEETREIAADETREIAAEKSPETAANDTRVEVDDEQATQIVHPVTEQQQQAPVPVPTPAAAQQAEAQQQAKQPPAKPFIPPPAPNEPGEPNADEGYAIEYTDEKPRSTAGRWIGGLLLVGVLVFAVVIGFQVLGGPEDEEPPVANEPAQEAPAEDPEEDDEAAEEEEEPEEPAGPPPEPASVERVVPDSPGLTSEYDADLPAIIDGNQATAWQTLTFTTPQFGGFASNLALIVELEEQAPISEITITQNQGSGGAFSVAAANEPDPNGGVVLTEGSFTGPEYTVDAHDSDGEPIEARYVIINFTELPTLSNTNSPDRPYGLRIAEIEVD